MIQMKQVGRQLRRGIGEHITDTRMGVQRLNDVIARVEVYGKPSMVTQ